MAGLLKDEGKKSNKYSILVEQGWEMGGDAEIAVMSTRMI